MKNPDVGPPRPRRTRGLDVLLVVLAFALLALAMAVILYLTSQPPAYDSSLPQTNPDPEMLPRRR